MFVITNRFNNSAVTIKFKRQSHALKYAMEVAMRTNKAGVRLEKQEKIVRVLDGCVHAWRGGNKTYAISARG